MSLRLANADAEEAQERLRVSLLSEFNVPCKDPPLLHILVRVVEKATPGGQARDRKRWQPVGDVWEESP